MGEFRSPQAKKARMGGTAIW